MRYGSEWLGSKKCNLLLLFVVLAMVSAGLTGCGGGSRKVSLDGGSSDGVIKSGNGVDYVYGIPMDQSAAIITEDVVDIYASPDVTSERVTQALYNQPVSVLQLEQGWAKVTAVDGSTGWVKRKYIDSDVSSIYGKTYTHRIIVTSRDKTITSYPSGGITQKVASMGSEFFSFNSSGDAYEVFLPGNKTGWLKGSGLIHVGLNEMVPVTNAEDFAATAKRLKGVSFLLNGISMLGIDSPGLVYICARINGIDLPKTLEGQMASGTEIKPDDTQAGDLVFLAGVGEGESGTVSCVGICTGGGAYLYAGRKAGYVAVGDINKDNAEGRIIAARRIFN